MESPADRESSGAFWTGFWDVQRPERIGFNVERSSIQRIGRIDERLRRLAPRRRPARDVGMIFKAVDIWEAAGARDVGKNARTFYAKR